MKYSPTKDILNEYQGRNIDMTEKIIPTMKIVVILYLSLKIMIILYMVLIMVIVL